MEGLIANGSSVSYDTIVHYGFCFHVPFPLEKSDQKHFNVSFIIQKIFKEHLLCAKYHAINNKDICVCVTKAPLCTVKDRMDSVTISLNTRKKMSNFLGQSQ